MASITGPVVEASERKYVRRRRVQQNPAALHAHGLEVVQDPDFMSGFLVHVAIEEVANLGKRVIHAACRGGGDRVEVPDDPVELAK